MRVLEWHLPPVIPMRWWSTVALFVAVCFVLVAWEARRASGWQRLAVVALVFVAWQLGVRVLAPAQPYFLDLRCASGSAEACAWLGEQARSAGDHVTATRYLERACDGSSESIARAFYGPPLACVGLASLQPERAATLWARLAPPNDAQTAWAADALAACFVKPVPACATACAEMAQQSLSSGPIGVHECLRYAPRRTTRRAPPASP
ncbi:MAG: hypothetical protein H6704_06095 [Myxococcales bacterium]|nr:hypothetical protein [Myxococcales bacterium]